MTGVRDRSVILGIVTALVASPFADAGAVNQGVSNAGYAPEPRGDAIALPLDDYGDMVVDEEHDQLFFSGGLIRGGPVVVTDEDGRNQRVLAHLDKAYGLLLSPDGETLYVALPLRSAIAEVDTETLLTTVLPTGEGTCPTSLAWSDDTVWWGGRCAGEGGTLGAYDPETRQVTTHLETEHYGSAPELFSSPLRPDELLIGDVMHAPTELSRARVSGGATPSIEVEVQRRDARGADNVAYLPGGERAVLAGGDNSRHAVIDLDDLGTVGAFPTAYHGGAVAVRDDGMVAAGVHDHGPGVYVYDAGHSRPEDGRAFDIEPGRLVRDLAFGDGRLYAVVSRSPYDRPPYLRILYPCTCEPVTVRQSTDRETYEWGDKAKLRVAVSETGAGGVVTVRRRVYTERGEVTRAVPVDRTTSFTRRVLIEPVIWIGARFEYPDGSHSPMDWLRPDSGPPPEGWVRTQARGEREVGERYTVVPAGVPARVVSDLYAVETRRLTYRVERHTRSGWRLVAQRSRPVQDFAARLRIKRFAGSGQRVRVRVVAGHRSATLTPTWTYIRHEG